MDKVQLQASRMSWVVNIELDGRDWQLFTFEDEAACNEAAKAINQGIKTLALMGCRSYRQYRELLVPFRKLGACDTEPECMLEDVLHDLGILPEGEGRFS